MQKSQFDHGAPNPPFLLQPMKLLIRVARTSLVKQYIMSPAIALISSHQSCLVLPPGLASYVTLPTPMGPLSTAVSLNEEESEQLPSTSSHTHS